jgi:hypothetical protein
MGSNTFVGRLGYALDGIYEYTIVNFGLKQARAVTPMFPAVSGKKR